MRDRESLNAADRAQLSECGIPLAEAERQLALLAGVDRGSEAKPATRLLRPATVGDGIERNGGEILKFMGDGLLAAFPVTDGEARDACDRALHAAVAAVDNTDRLNIELAAEGRQPLRFGIGLHIGEVAFGNIGTHKRLDFTVIGPAVNQASRLQDLTKTVGCAVVASAAFADACGRPMRRLGRHRLRGVEEPFEICGL